MPAPLYENPPIDPLARLRELLEENIISEEIADLRLQLLRRDHADCIVQIDEIRADDTAIAFRATIGVPGGGRHTGVATDDVDADTSWSDQLKQVEAIAVAKALDGLGFTLDRLMDRPATSPEEKRSDAPADEDHLPEYSWNAFWQTMNTRKITREQVEQALGKSVQEATPKEAVDALRTAGVLG